MSKQTMVEERVLHIYMTRIRSANNQLMQQRYISKHLTDALHELVFWDTNNKEWRLRPSIVDMDVTTIVGHLLHHDD